MVSYCTLPRSPTEATTVLARERERYGVECPPSLIFQLFSRLRDQESGCDTWDFQFCTWLHAPVTSWESSQNNLQSWSLLCTWFGHLHYFIVLYSYRILFNTLGVTGTVLYHIMTSLHCITPCEGNTFITKYSSDSVLHTWFGWNVMRLIVHHWTFIDLLQNIRP